MKTMLTVFLLSCAVVFLVPEFSPRQFLFGVRVPDGFRSSGPGRRALLLYRLSIAALCVIGLGLIASHFRGGPAVPLLLLVAGSTAVTAVNGRALKPHEIDAQPRLHVIELSSEPDRLPRYAWLACLPVSTSVAAALYLHQNWDRIPERFPIHWGVNGKPNGWSHRTIGGVYAPLILGALLVWWLSLLQYATWHGSRRSAHRRATVLTVTAVQLVSGLVFPMTALAPLFHLSPGLMAAVTIGLVLSAVITALSGAMRTAAEPVPEPDPTPGQNWKAGRMLYFNPDDPAFFVPRRQGQGFTPNLAHLTPCVLCFAPPTIAAITLCWVFLKAR